MLFLEASAKTAEQVNESFMGVTHSVLNSLGKEKTKNKTDIGKKMELAHSRENNKPQGSCCYWFIKENYLDKIWSKIIILWLLFYQKGLSQKF